MTLPWYLNPWREVRRLRLWIRSREEAAFNLTREAWDTRVEMLKLRDENAELKRKVGELHAYCSCLEGKKPLCGCQRCTGTRPALKGWDAPGFRYACEKCGNKRCPHHRWHEFKCTDSNGPDQGGEVG